GHALLLFLLVDLWIRDAGASADEGRRPADPGRPVVGVLGLSRALGRLRPVHDLVRGVLHEGRRPGEGPLGRARGGHPGGGPRWLIRPECRPTRPPWWRWCCSPSCRSGWEWWPTGS